MRSLCVFLDGIGPYFQVFTNSESLSGANKKLIFKIKYMQGQNSTKSNFADQVEFRFLIKPLSGNKTPH
jgi:hypothetical protein